MKKVILFLLTMMFSSPLLFAGTIHPLLQDKLENSETEYVRIIISLQDRLSKNKLNNELSLTSYTRQAAHSLAVKALKSHAENTQSNIIAFLQVEKNKKNVRSFKSYWIDNLIMVEIKPELVNDLSAFTEIETIYPEIEIPLTLPNEEVSQGIIQRVSSVGDNLKVIGADSMWNLGYTGQGTLLASFDTGVQGDHPALIGNYRGTSGYSYEQCWFDPIENDTFPHVFMSIGDGSSRAHGTGTLGLIVGKDESSGDTTGVAIDAQWIAAGVIDITDPVRGGLINTRIIDAFQWAADPDGDPNTIHDVPDVLSNSWGYPGSILGCTDLFYGIIDNLEALGVVVMFAAGNSGNWRTLAYPANRTDSDYNSFAVGMITNDYINIELDGMSSRGPSICDPEIIKPNVVAPGRNVPTTLPTSTYGTGTGTSFAVPHAAGAALLLRQYNPNAPVDSIKKALMLSAIDIEDPGPDSAAGYGLVYIPEALNYLDPISQPNVFVKSVTYNSIQPGDVVEFVITLGNSGLGILNIDAKIRSDRTDLTLIDSSYSYGNIALGAEADNSSAPFSIEFSEEILNGTELTVDLYITGSGSYENTIPVYFRVGPEQNRGTFTHDAGAVQLTVSNYGQFGLQEGSVNNQGGVGFAYDPSAFLYEMSMLITADSNHISNSTRNILGISDEDFMIAPDGRLRVFIPSMNASQHTLSRYTDALAEKPMGLEITQKTYAYDSYPADHIILIVYILKNIADSTLTDLKVSMFADFDFFDFGSNDRTGFNRASNLGYMWSHDQNNYRGIAVLNDEGVTSYRSIYWSVLYNGFTNSEKWQFATEGFVDTANLTPNDYSHMITTGMFDLAPGEIDTAAFAVMAGDSLAHLINELVPQAQFAYADFLLDAEDDPEETVIPDQFNLSQNYPNPFNPSTTIEFDLSRGQQIKLEIYNILGQKVETVINEYRPSGSYKVRWDSSEDGKNLASGVYFYRLSSEDFTSTRKMILLK